MSKEKRLYVRVLPTVFNPRADSTDDIIMVNDDFNPILIHNQYFTGQVVFRVAEFRGLAPVLNNERQKPIQKTSYFENRGRKFSLQVEGRFRHTWSGDDILFGVFFQKPIILHKGFQVAVSMARYIDPALVGDLLSDKPYLCSPITCGMNMMGKKEAPKSLKEASKVTAKYYKDDQDYWKEYEASKNELCSKTCTKVNCDICSSESSSSISSELDVNKASIEEVEKELAHKLHKMTPSKVEGIEEIQKINLNCDKKCIEFSKCRPLLLPDWEYGGNQKYLEENLISFPEKRLFDFNFLSGKKDSENSTAELDVESQLKITKRNSKKRRQHFLNEANRQNFLFDPDTVYGFEFTSSYADLNVFELKLGVRIEVEKYVNGQPIVYEARTRDGVVFWRIELGLTHDY